MNRAVGLGLRALQILIGATILGIAASLIANQVVGDSPVTTRYATFTGGFGMMVGLVGVASLLASFIPEVVPLALDGLAALLFLAGGIAWAVGLRNLDNCNNYQNMLQNGLLNEGTLDVDGQTLYGVITPGHEDEAPGKLRGNCQRATADEALQFISFGLALALVGFGFLQVRRGGKGGGVGVYVA
ncbi:06bdf356-a8e0-4154-8eca-9029144a05ed [Thermothielavioides terrestris]|uniref:MARVEL domain-containing protein n=2 Tax=Thermothielavioides terrestris TaxID=2587410 RepID=G2REH6_THETT|nr:uncharacterized protein THITE_2132357 [Thermothielavioides terrestris NRRL 8126]AEO70951.1 hypothetical protein THITE_2132357 [Thermothielavioides terrestris NRRL 8126]SPQ25055.1 06bdf356-a8e0-4154-8eca-9029144a05ed [Thermothielavioides terrestris]